MAWTKKWSTPEPTPAASARSLAAIMQEQSDERFVREHFAPSELKEAKAKVVRAPQAQLDDDDFEAQLALAPALALSASEAPEAETKPSSASSASPSPSTAPTLSSDAELAARLQREEEESVGKPTPSLIAAGELDNDEKIARLLQEEERQRYGSNQAARKELSVHEMQVLGLGYESEEEMEFDDEGNPIFFDEDEETEYDYTEPSPDAQDVDPDDPDHEATLLYDGAQRREDKELAHVTKRDPSKRVNSAPVALHHRNYDSRNRGKLQAERFLPFDEGRRKARSKVKQERIGLPLREPEQFAYGLITSELGGNNFLVYTYFDGRTRTCRLTRALAASRVGGRPFARSWIVKGDIVVVRYRSYVKDKGDLIVRLTRPEYEAVPKTDFMSEQDPAKILPPELLFRIFDFVPLHDRPNLHEVTERWREVFDAFRLHRLRVLSDRVAEQTENAPKERPPAVAEVNAL